MRIAVNARFLLPAGLEGLGQYSHETLRRLAALRPADELVFFFDRPFDPRYLYGPNVRAEVLFPPARHPFLWWIWFEVALRRALRRGGFDVFFSPDQFLSLGAGVPTVLTCHDLLALRWPEQLPFWPRHFYRRYFPKYLRAAARVAAISEATRQDVLALGGIGPERVSTVPLGLRSGFSPLSGEAVALARQKWADGRPYFLYAGAIQPRKNLARLIEAFDRFKSEKNRTEKLLLAGRRAWLADDVQAAFDRSAHRADIRFLGFVPDEGLRELMGAARAFVFPSIAEGFGLPILEAMSADVPALTSAVSSMPEVAGGAALLVDPFSVESIAAGLSALAEDDALCRDLVEKGRVRRAMFSFDRHAERISALLDEAAAQRG